MDNPNSLVYVYSICIWYRA